jgi:hypothetical protein
MPLLKIQLQRRLLRNKKAVSPAISTVILTAATIVMILVATSYANNYLSTKMAQNEYIANKQFMLTTGLQIDDIAWTVGRTQTIRYATTYGGMQYQSLALNYTFEVLYTATNTWSAPIAANTTGMIMFNMPITSYNLGNNYYEQISVSDGSFVQDGSSAPVADVFCVEKLPMPDGNYSRIIAVPSVRYLTSTIIGSGNASTHYYKFYLPTLVKANSNPYLSEAVSLTGLDIEKIIVSGISKVRVNVTYPNGAPQTTNKFDSDFFQLGDSIDFYHNSKTIDLSSNSVVELYIGKVAVAIGQP